MVEIRLGDIVEYKIAGIEGNGFSGTGMVIDANVIEGNPVDGYTHTNRIVIKDKIYKGTKFRRHKGGRF